MLKIAALALAAAGAVAAQSRDGDEPLRDWGRVHKLRPDQQLVIRPFKGMGDKVLATYISSDATRIVVRLKNDQELEISKDRIRSVIRRKRMRNAVLAGAGAGFAVMALWTTAFPDFAQPFAALLFGGVGAGIGAATGGLVRYIGHNMIVYRAAKPSRRRSGVS
ncbi:MAG: hypothetical protein OXN96_06620 [Bryobacterales bacterium]|nr:hypothetical protein [Bryobacterales bacterium]MDE0624454.1 hypothetical protein [Bryobacterales bacterium]